MKKYVLEIQLSPNIHKDEMKYYWQIKQKDGNNEYSVTDGWAKNLAHAHNNAILTATQKGLI